MSLECYGCGSESVEVGWKDLIKHKDNVQVVDHTAEWDESSNLYKVDFDSIMDNIGVPEKERQSAKFYSNDPDHFTDDDFDDCETSEDEMGAYCLDCGTMI